MSHLKASALSALGNRPGSHPGRKAMSENRFSVRMSDSLAQQLNEIAERTGLSKAEVFSRAISLYKIAKLAQMNHEEVIIRSDTKERELISI
jgi:predicted HicB family RNase H-like nuclease